jgi:predicted GNAT family acetyltransferase
MTSDDLSVTDNPGESRFELRDGDELLGRLDYRPAGASVIIAHTEVASDRGQSGLGSTLVRGALDQLRARGTTVIPTCPFTAAFIQRHPEYADVVDPSLRGQFR